ncbi:hypothetical protein Kpol_322p2 [Vanderwaltozyma polyspora DSM 70294]|uniref:RNA helicase n=1 Tax=Vanderwaltozyma polyspora (strain ATCC 22028 / DSM 70294 / BCRC 21397 / CBS 2163 / NBRC 10782 / NRRL Y-8283 / UCD 57-17) TaxID=436907 RepID=A7TSX6_VANPO|nr:uncharacterized protein Kpol_322p2 [Vanderwaltozyma polyspora DSM 70294]EDO14625.1 hypothetical protein Kpol_322p2 [Vanderwaltozyma polyspora DSM 70294]
MPNETDIEVSKIIGIDDPVVLNFVKDIRSKCHTADDFQHRITDLDIGLSNESIKKLYRLLSTSDSNVKREISKVLDSELNISDNVVTEFVLNILQSCFSLTDFERKMNELDVGLTREIIVKIYNLLNTTNEIKLEALEEEKKFESSEKAKLNKVHNDRFEYMNIQRKDEFPESITSNPFLDESPIVNKIYKGKVRSITSFGCFVQILGTKKINCDGLVHISQLSQHHINDPYEIISVNQIVYIKVIKVQRNGKISLSMKEVDQKTGRDLNIKATSKDDTFKNDDRGRSTNIPNTKIKRRKLTSPERWEIQQLIASGAADINDYPELLEDNLENSESVSKTMIGKNEAEEVEEEEEFIDIELNTDDKAPFLKGELSSQSKRFEMPKIMKIPKGSMNRAAMYGSNLIKDHRETKFKKKKEIEKEIRKKLSMDDPTKNPREKFREIDELRQQLVLTAWERNRMRERISYGKRTVLPISSQRQSLPVYKMKSQLMDAVKNNQFLVIVGETGSGKTTQITQYLYDEGFGDTGIIGCTQPRRVAAVSVANRVAEEFGCKIGNEVGYTIRFEDVTNQKTRIKYMTDGILQIEALSDPVMSKYSVIMLDEAHERTVATDVLFALLKKAASQRPDLKVIVTSATLDSAKFSEYFGNCPVINIPGKTFPVEVFYAQAPQMDYIEAALDSVMEIHINEGPGDVLVFLTGQEEIDSCCEMLYSRVKELGDTIGELLILPVYSALPSEIQSKIFEPTQEGQRKVVFATNIAETSITIDGIYYVIDPGFSKINIFNPKTGMEQLVVKPISQAQANQRKGRAGRTGPGKCYRLYTESAFYNEMSPNSVPEIQRQNLSHTILMLKAMGIEDVINFEFMDAPPRALMIGAMEQLYNLGALGDEGQLTELGQHMSQFPTDPSLSRSLLSSVSNNCVEEIVIIISMISIQSVFYRPKEHQQEADQKKMKFFHPYGDHLTLLNVYKRWEQTRYSEQFCEMNYLHYKHLLRARDIGKQLRGILEGMKLWKSGNNCSDIDSIRRALVNGFFLNAAKRDGQEYKTIHGNNSVEIHPSSSLFGREYEYVIYHSLVMTSREYMSQVLAIEPKWLIESAPHFYKEMDVNSNSRKRAKIVPLHNRYSKDQNSWRLTSIRQSRERALGVKR